MAVPKQQQLEHLIYRSTGQVRIGGQVRTGDVGQTCLGGVATMTQVTSFFSFIPNITSMMSISSTAETFSPLEQISGHVI